MLLLKNAALSVSQTPFTEKSAYRAGILFAESAYRKIGSITSDTFHANLVTAVQ